ncbi:MAG: PorT family protein [Rikenellaceae bacterium]|nr:PorT family protein [Rikenellaceae bacterium]
MGATTPVPIPDRLDIRSYHPRVNPKLGANLTYYFDSHWGIGAGLTLDWKGMKVHTRVTDVHLTVQEPSLGMLTGYVTGRNRTSVRTLYLVQPLYGSYRFNARWQVRAGIYLAETLNRRFDGNVTDVQIQVQSPLSVERDVAYTTLDYSDEARTFETGLLAGGEFRINRRIGLFADFTWAFTPFFERSVPIHFTMRNIYLALGATFRW